MKYKVGDKVKVKRERYILQGIQEDTRIGEIKSINYSYYGVYTDKCVLWCTDEDIEELLPNTITNRQWLEGLSDEELSKFNKDSFCKICPYNTGICNKGGTKYCDFVKVYTSWLQAEHKE